MRFADRLFDWLLGRQWLESQLCIAYARRQRRRFEQPTGVRVEATEIEPGSGGLEVTRSVWEPTIIPLPDVTVTAPSTTVFSSPGTIVPLPDVKNAAYVTVNDWGVLRSVSPQRGGVSDGE